MSNKVVCVVPTRGLVYAKTIKSLLQEVEHNKDIVTSPHIIDDLGMPDCFNEAAEVAIEHGATHIWFVEEDNEVVPGVLQEMLQMDKPIVTVDYNVGKGISHICIGERGDILWCGLGCTLIKKEVFETLKKPWFEVTKHINQKTGEVIEISNQVAEKKYGGHDVWFCTQARKAGFTIHKLPEKKGQHFRALEIQKREMNKGYYTITSL